MAAKVNKFAPKPGEDLIDFPISPDWVKHYAGLGITADYPPEYYQKPDTMTVEKIRELDAIAKRLELVKASGPVTKQELGELKYLVNKLLERVNRIEKRETGY